MTVVEEIIPEKLNLFKEKSLSRNTITIKYKYNKNILAQLQIKTQKFKYLYYIILKELASLESLNDQITGADILEKVDHCIKNLGTIFG